VVCAVVPSMRARRLVWRMTARMYWRCPVSVIGSMKSITRVASACKRCDAAGHDRLDVAEVLGPDLVDRMSSGTWDQVVQC
jgi:hypothetical protein